MNAEMCRWRNYATVHAEGWSADGVEVTPAQTNLQKQLLLELRPKISMTNPSATRDSCFPSVARIAEATLNRLLRLCRGCRCGPHGFMLIVMELSVSEQEAPVKHDCVECPKHVKHCSSRTVIDCGERLQFYVCLHDHPSTNFSRCSTKS